MVLMKVRLMTNSVSDCSSRMRKVAGMRVKCNLVVASINSLIFFIICYSRKKQENPNVHRYMDIKEVKSEQNAYNLHLPNTVPF